MHVNYLYWGTIRYYSSKCQINALLNCNFKVKQLKSTKILLQNAANLVCFKFVLKVELLESGQMLNSQLVTDLKNVEFVKRESSI